MKKKFPTFETDEETERFVETADLTEYDLSQFKPIRVEFEKKAARVNMRLPETLLKGQGTRRSPRHPTAAGHEAAAVTMYRRAYGIASGPEWRIEVAKR
jgi:hypothetical protein